MTPRVFLPSVICVGSDTLGSVRDKVQGVSTVARNANLLIPQLIGAETSVANLSTPTLKMSTRRPLGRGFQSRGASVAAGRGGRGRGRGGA